MSTSKMSHFNYCWFGTILLILYLVTSGCGHYSQDMSGDVFGNGISKFNVFPAAFSDYNSDRKTDLVVVVKNFSSFYIYLGSNAAPFLQRNKKFKCDLTSIFGNASYYASIIGTNLADFTGDGINDIMVTFNLIDNVHYPDPSKPLLAHVAIFKGDLTSLSCQPLDLQPNSIKVLTFKNEPLILDVNGDMTSDLFGESTENERQFWVFESHGALPTKINFNCSSSRCNNVTKSAFVDIDGDYQIDLVLLTFNFSTKLTTKPNFYLEVYDMDLSYNEIDSLPKEVISLNVDMMVPGNPLFLDMSVTGGPYSVIIPYCRDLRCQKSYFALIEPISRDVVTLDVTLADSTGGYWTFITDVYEPRYLKTINVRSGDYDLDGYPDLVATLVQVGTSSSQADSRAVLFKNVPCLSADCKYPRTFRPNFNVFSHYKSVLGVAFFDANDNGLLDVIGVRKSVNESFEMFVVENTPNYDAYFIKWTLTSGICGTNCPPYGVLLPGASMKYIRTNNEGGLSIGRGSQLIRGGFGLDFPGNLMGTGASANFIDTIIFSISPTVTYTRTQIIPNSNLIVIPPSPGSKKWEMKHILKPNNEGILATFHVLLFIFIINVAIVFVLHVREKKEDQAERHKNPVSMSALTMA